MVATHRRQLTSNISQDLPTRTADRVDVEKLSAESRRVNERKTVDISVSFWSDHNFFAGFSENISEGGLFVATDDYKPVGTQIELTFDMPDYDREVSAVAEVAWVRLPQPHAPDIPAGMGLRFVEIDNNSVSCISDFVACRSPIFYED